MVLPFLYITKMINLDSITGENNREHKEQMYCLI